MQIKDLDFQELLPNEDLEVVGGILYNTFHPGGPGGPHVPPPPPPPPCPGSLFVLNTQLQDETSLSVYVQ